MTPDEIKHEELIIKKLLEYLELESKSILSEKKIYYRLQVVEDQDA